MNVVKALQWGKAVGYIAGGGCAGVFLFLAAINAKNSVQWIAAGGALIAIAGLVNVLWPAPAHTLQVAPGANIPVVNGDGKKTGATVVTTDSTKEFVAPHAPSSAPQKGTP